MIEGAATDGYAGRIELVIAIGKDGRLSGVRVIAHKETPGLGDYIDPKKDRRKDGPWIGQFSGATWTGVNTAEWTVVQGRRQLRLPRRRHHQRACRHARSGPHHRLRHRPPRRTVRRPCRQRAGRRIMSPHHTKVIWLL